jgi:hypothetical protein
MPYAHALFPRICDWLGWETVQSVMPVTEPLASSVTNSINKRGDTIMEKIALLFALAFAFTMGMAVVTVVAPTDRAMADSAGTVVVYPEQASQCDGTNC